MMTPMGLGQMPAQYAQGQMAMPQTGMIHPAVLAQLQQMHGLFGMRPSMQQGFGQNMGYPQMGIQPLSPASVGSLR